MTDRAFDSGQEQTMCDDSDDLGREDSSTSTDGVSTAATQTDPANARVIGQGESASGQTLGMFGEVDATTNNAAGVAGEASADSGQVSGVFGEVSSPSGRGVTGVAKGSSIPSLPQGQSIGVFGVTDLSSLDAGTNKAYGVAGYAPAFDGETDGVFGQSDSTDGYGVYGLIGIRVAICR